ncbi:MAG: hypothetical protein EAZ80_12350, partial [Runella slithyformis]
LQRIVERKSGRNERRSEERLKGKGESAKKRIKFTLYHTARATPTLKPYRTGAPDLKTIHQKSN